MKCIISLILVICTLMCLSGCVTQEEVDTLNAKIASLEKNLAAANKQIDSLKDKNDTLNADLRDNKTALENANSALQQEQANAATLQEALNKALGEVDELKNGPDRALAAIRTAYEAKKWKEVISLSNSLHSKYPGMDQDIEARKLAADAQKVLDDEKAKAEAEAAKNAQDKVRGLIRITELSCSSPNSAGGVGINLHFVNMHPEKTIKYLYVTVYPYNAVGDMMDCDIRDYSSYTCEATGPFGPGQGINASTGWWWPNAWYNWNIKYIELSSVRIVYTDGTSVRLSSSELPYAIW